MNKKKKSELLAELRQHQQANQSLGYIREQMHLTLAEYRDLVRLAESVRLGMVAEWTVDLPKRTRDFVHQHKLLDTDKVRELLMTGSYSAIPKFTSTTAQHLAELLNVELAAPKPRVPRAKRKMSLPTTGSMRSAHPNVQQIKRTHPVFPPDKPFDTPMKQALIADIYYVRLVEKHSKILNVPTEIILRMPLPKLARPNSVPPSIFALARDIYSANRDSFIKSDMLGFISMDEKRGYAKAKLNSSSTPVYYYDPEHILVSRRPQKAGRHHIGTGVTFFCHDGKGRFLMGKRSELCRDEQGVWCIGGGEIHFGEQALTALRRELKEEYGAAPLHVEFLGYRDAMRSNDSFITHWLMLDFLVQVDPETVRLGEPHKIEVIDWFTLDTVPAGCHSQWPSFLDQYRDQLTQVLTKQD
jgi:8-oxo-dGTP diphosphatase